MMVCSKSMINVATRMQQRWGIPYFEGSFYGIADMSTTLREIARLLVERGAPADLADRTEALIAVEEARAWERIRAYRERLAGKKVLLITGGVKSWSVVSALLRLLALSGHGLALVSSIVVERELQAHQLRTLIRVPGLAERFYGISLRRRFSNALIEQVVAEFRARLTALTATRAARRRIR